MRSRALNLIGALALFAYGLVAGLVNGADRSADAVERRRSVLFGPSAASLGGAADLHLDAALSAMSNPGLAPDEQLPAYRQELRFAEKLLLDSLRAQPAQAEALAKLAAVRWEIDPSCSAASVQNQIRLVELAAGMAPTVPRVRARLGLLLFRMGRHREALEYLSRAIELNPTLAPEVVAFLSENLLGPEAILRSMPHRPTVLVALRQPFFDESKELEYLQVLEEAFAQTPGDPQPSLMTSYGSACLRIHAARRLRDRMSEFGRLQDGYAEAERLRQRSRANRVLRSWEAAVQDAVRAAGTKPEIPQFAENLGDVLQAAGKPGQAIQSYREALSVMARRSAGSGWRGRIYRKIGQAEEKRNAPDRAFDAYELALRLDPEESIASRRLRELTAGAVARGVSR